MTNREICLKAAQRLREVGWPQGGFGPEQGPGCMLDACRWAAGHYAALTAARAALDAATAAVSAAVSHYYTTNWNDPPGRGVEEVIAMLEACP